MRNHSLPFRNRNRGLGLRPVETVKHVVDNQGGLVIGVTTPIDIIKTVESPVIGNSNEVRNPCTVHGVFMHIEVSSTTSAAIGNVYMALYKSTNNLLGTIDPQTIGSNANKRYVIHQEMTMAERSTAGNPRVLFKGVVVIPRGYKRFGANDRLELVLKTTGVAMDFCVQTIYKEFR